MGKRKRVRQRKRVIQSKSCAVQSSPDVKSRDGAPSYEFFYEILVLIVSLLHGELFFVLVDRTISLINNYSITDLSLLLFFFTLFFRIFQTHLLAAVKYTEKWSFKPLDFILVFITAAFEYIMFCNDRIIHNPTRWYYYSIFCFCVFGIAGYIITYCRTCSRYSGREKPSEIKLQVINGICVFIIGALHFSLYFGIAPLFINQILVNFASSLILLINIFLSLNMSKAQLMGHLNY